jgi:hypothetical protein
MPELAIVNEWGFTRGPILFYKEGNKRLKRI